MRYLAHLLVVFVLAQLCRAKVASCRVRFHNDSWLYCTKFGAPANANLQVNFKSKLIAVGALPPGDADRVFFDVAIYQDDKWDELQLL
jgi:hypothetical protein